LKKLEEVFNDDLAKWVVRYPWSAKPGEVGNVFIFGHSSNFPWVKWKYNDVFALLNHLQKNDKIIVYYNQKKYVYKVTTKAVINPWEVGILKRNKWKEELTLMTCWPIWTTLKRKIIIAELIK
jgi:sortase A